MRDQHSEELGSAAFNNIDKSTLGRAGQCGFGGRGVTVYDLQIVHKIMVLIANTWGKGSENVLT